MTESQLEEFATMERGKHKKEMKTHMGKRGKMPMKPMSKMPTGASQSPSGDIGAKRQAESEKAGGFKAGSVVSASSAF